MHRYRIKTEVSKTLQKLQIHVAPLNHSLQLLPHKPSKSKSYQLLKKPYSPSTIKLTVPVSTRQHVSPQYHSSASKQPYSKKQSKSPQQHRHTPLHTPTHRLKNWSPVPVPCILNINKTHNQHKHTDSRQHNQPNQKGQIHSKLTAKFFRKQRNLSDKLSNMLRAPIPKRKAQFQMKYLKKLGSSQTGQILLTYSKHTNLLVAIKTFQRDKIRLEFLIDELKIQLYCRHPHILPAYGYFIARQEVYLMMEPGIHNLYQEILAAGPFKEEVAANYALQVLEAVEYLHRNGVMHRDLKPENVICFGSHIKITDFGWSIRNETMRTTLCGTLDYMSPQVSSRKKYDEKIDCWSVGVLIYEMLTVRPPFEQEQMNFDFGKLAFPKGISRCCIDLLKNLLEADPLKRYSATQALNHRWICKAKELSEQDPTLLMLQQQTRKIMV